MAKQNQTLDKIQEFIDKAQDSKKTEKMDLSSDQDLSLAIMNLISIEEHFFFTGAKTGKSEYYKMLKKVREIRKQLLKKIIKDYEGEVWCISKHLLSSSMRLMEVGTKQMELGKQKIAKDMFEKSYELYSLFWALNLNIISSKDLKKIPGNKLDKKDKTKNGVWSKLGELVKKAIDCCIE
jgi:hypothetical protein